MNKVICITKNSIRFTCGKIYDVIKSDNIKIKLQTCAIIDSFGSFKESVSGFYQTVTIIADDGSAWDISNNMLHHTFITLEQHRENQLNKIGI